MPFRDCGYLHFVLAARKGFFIEAEDDQIKKQDGKVFSRSGLLNQDL